MKTGEEGGGACVVVCWRVGWWGFVPTAGERGGAGAGASGSGTTCRHAGDSTPPQVLCSVRLRYCTAFFTRRSSLLPPASSEPRVTGWFASAPTRPGCIQPHGFACPRLFFLMQAREGVNLLSGKNATDGKASETHSASNETVRWGGAVACACLLVGGWVGYRSGVRWWRACKVADLM